MAFCPKCGKQGIKGRFCKECAEKELNLDFKDIELKYCVECGKCLLKNRWQEADLKKAIVMTALAKIRNPERIALKITPKYEHKKGKPGFDQPIELYVSADDQEFVLPAKIKNTYCTICSKKDTDYLEGVLQLRNADKELVGFVKNDLALHSKEIFVVKEKIKGDSADFILTSSKYIRAMGKRLKQKFNGELSENAKLFSKNKQTGKNIYRINVLFKQRKFKVGDVVTDNRGRKIKIKTLGKRVSGIDVETGKKVFAEF
jgi:NMD protein affecting ribosome stability and mRNA decay